MELRLLIGSYHTQSQTGHTARTGQRCELALLMKFRQYQVAARSACKAYPASSGDFDFLRFDEVPGRRWVLIFKHHTVGILKVRLQFVKACTLAEYARNLRKAPDEPGTVLPILHLKSKRHEIIWAHRKPVESFRAPPPISLNPPLPKFSAGANGRAALKLLVEFVKGAGCIFLGTFRRLARNTD